MSHPLHILFFLLCGHFIFDFPLQGDTVAREKNPGSTSELQKHVPFYYWAVAHAFSHAFAVALATRSMLCALIELGSHLVIDYLKCKQVFNIHVDQALHISFKLLYVGILCWSHA